MLRSIVAELVNRGGYVDYYLQYITNTFSRLIYKEITLYKKLILTFTLTADLSVLPNAFAAPAALKPKTTRPATKPW